MIQILCGTNRPGSNTRKITSIVEGLYRDLKASSEVIDLAHLPREIFEPSSYAQKPAAFEPIAQKIVEADGLVVITPEYNGSLPGVLKYFIDMLPFPASFERKPVCFIGVAAGMWGALRPIEQLELIFGYRNAYIYPERVFMPHINGLLNEAGQLKDADLVDRLRTQAAGFVDFVERLKK